MTKGDTLVSIDDDDVMLVEDEVVYPHRLCQFVLEGSRCGPGGTPLSFDFDWMFVGNDQASWKRSKILSPKGACYTSDSSSLTSRSDNLIASSNAFSIFSCLEVGSLI